MIKEWFVNKQVYHKYTSETLQNRPFNKKLNGYDIVHLDTINCIVPLWDK